MSVSGLGRRERASGGPPEGVLGPWRPYILPPHPLASLPRHDVVEVAGLTSFSFGEDDECRYVMIFKKVKGPSPLPSSLLSSLRPPPRERGLDETRVWSLDPMVPLSPGVCAVR